MSEVCVIFDLDGTLVDSEELCNQAFVDLLPELEESAESLTAHFRGLKLSSILADLEQRLGHPLPPDFEPRYRLRVAELFELSLKPTAGTPEMLQRLGHPCCVASSGPPQKIAHALKLAGLAAFFGDRIFSSYVVGSWKPDPGLFQYAANALGFQPNRCVVVEDSEVGLLAANAAGMHALHYNPSGSRRGSTSHASFSDMVKLPELIRAIAAAT